MGDNVILTEDRPRKVKICYEGMCAGLNIIRLKCLYEQVHFVEVQIYTYIWLAVSLKCGWL